MDTSILFQILLSLVLGVLIGLEREVHHKAAGSRTMALITIGATLFTIMSPSLCNGDNSRIIAQIVSGVGFLGAGLIFKSGNTVKGLTTAATIWASAAIGCLVGCCMYREAILGTSIILVVNLLFGKLKCMRHRKTNEED